MGMEIGQAERMRGLRVDTVCFGMTESVGLFFESKGENRLEVAVVVSGVGVFGVEEGELPCKTGDVFVTCPEVIISLSYELEVPVCFVGTGEKIDDIEEFDSQEFIEAMF